MGSLKSKICNRVKLLYSVKFNSLLEMNTVVHSCWLFVGAEDNCPIITVQWCGDYYYVTVQWRGDDYYVTVQWRGDDYYVTVQWRGDGYYVTVQWRGDRFYVTVTVAW